MTTKNDIRNWFNEGLTKNATHMIVVCDTFDYEDYPIFVLNGEDVYQKINRYSQNMQRIVEIYSYSLPLEEQLKEHRAYHI